MAVAEKSGVNDGTADSFFPTLGRKKCLLHSGNAPAVKDIFEKMLKLNPRDNQDVRFVLDVIDSGKNWNLKQYR